MKRCVHPLLAALPAAVLLAACASAPPAAGTAPAPSPPSPPAPAAAPPEDARLLCREGYRALSWPSLGLPRFTDALDVALAEDTVWVLVAPAILVRVPRDEESEEKPTFVSSPDPEIRWTGVDVDPADGSLWLSKAGSYELVHLDAAGKAVAVPLTRVTGDGGLAGVLAGPAALHATPTCADHALWSFERSGEMVAAAFEAPESLADAGGDRVVNMRFACPRVHLARDAAGAVVAFNPMDARLHRAGSAGDWTATGRPYALQPPGRYSEPGALRSEPLSPEGAAAYLPDLVNGLFFLEGEPVLLGSPAQPGQQAYFTDVPYGIGTILLRDHEGVLRPSFESCGGRVLLHVETDADGFAALTREGLLLGR
ncbi:MAG TPA: hypothetical protein VHQ65_02710 [Thermoanaerobaculia bacterium]|nr:hypothetical protein [Thermoanaerobaculia bacterium]